MGVSTALSAPTTSGVRIARRHTVAGHDPYEGVKWGTRDVIMRNWRDNSINFEQRGVLFPLAWSDTSVQITASKYFRGALGTPDREWSLKQVVDRIVDTYTREGLNRGYFATPEDADAFSAELKYALVSQQFAFNSPVWFNVGTKAKPQVSACYILAVQDDMDSILNWYKEEGKIFQGGSGAGVNLSKIRSSKELLSSGGSASGPVSFMRGADASAGTIKSGGATRRAAKMVVLDVDHPDIEEFISIKAAEENKIRVLRDAGFDMELGGKDISSVQYQNANNSVRVTDEFMQAVVDGGQFALTARTDGRVIDHVDARSLFTNMAQAAWECADPGIQYDGSIQQMHTLKNEGKINASNPCSEFVHLDNTSCNLASINLLHFFDESTGHFDVEGFTYLCALVFAAAEISVSFGSFPTDAIGEGTRKSRPIGLGYANLGAMLMCAGVGYDTDLGRGWAAAITSLMTAQAYRTSAELAQAMGPFELFEANRESMLAVLDIHAASADTLAINAHSQGLVDAPQAGNLAEVLEAGQTTWRHVLDEGAVYGLRNSQATVLAPTGTISLVMGCETTGMEPDLALVKSKKLADGGSLVMENHKVPIALKTLGYTPGEVNDIVQHLRATSSITGAPHLRDEHLAVFATAMGDNTLSAMGHLLMVAAVQPFLSGAASKTVNLPETATVADIEHVYMQGWLHGLKALSVYRDECKVGQPLSVKLAGSGASNTAERAPKTVAPSGPSPARRRLPRTAQAHRTSFAVGDAEGYMHTGEYEDGTLGEVFIKMSKQGTTLAGVFESVSIAISIGLQYGVPLEVLASKFLGMNFEPKGLTDDPDVRIVTSVMDYLFRVLALRYCTKEVRESLGVYSLSERQALLDAPAAATEDVSVKSVAPVGQTIAIIKDRHLPLCMACGAFMVPSGSCFACSCGHTSGCS